MFLQFLRFFRLSVRGSQKGVKKIFEKFSCFFLLRIQFAKKKNPKIWGRARFGPFWPKKGAKGFFSEKSDSASFYPSYSPNFMQKIRKN